MLSTVEGREVPDGNEELRAPSSGPIPGSLARISASGRSKNRCSISSSISSMLWSLRALGSLRRAHQRCGRRSTRPGQGNALRLGGGESLASDAVESFDAAVSEVSGDALVSRSPELRRALVAGQEGKRPSPVQIQRSLQSRR